MWSTYTSPGWLLVAASVLLYVSLNIRIDAGTELVEFRYLTDTGHDWRRRKYLVARNVHRIATVLFVAAVIYAWAY